jgi:hypothetical protein
MQSSRHWSGLAIIKWTLLIIVALAFPSKSPADAVEYTFTASWTANYAPYPSSNVTFSFQILLNDFVTATGYASAQNLIFCNVTGIFLGPGAPAGTPTPCAWVGMQPIGNGSVAGYPQIDVAYSYQYPGTNGGAQNAFYFPYGSFSTFGVYNAVPLGYVPGFFSQLIVTDVPNPLILPTTLSSFPPSPPPPSNVPEPSSLLMLALGLISLRSLRKLSARARVWILAVARFSILLIRGISGIDGMFPSNLSSC